MSIGSVPINFAGNLTADPELRFTPSGVAAVRFSVAVNARVFDKLTNAWKDGDPSFFQVTAWRQLAENIAESLHRGDRVVVAGVLAQEHWEDPKTGEKRSGWKVTADAVGADLTWSTAVLTKSRRQAFDGPPDEEWATASRTRPAESVKA